MTKRLALAALPLALLAACSTSEHSNPNHTVAGPSTTASSAASASTATSTPSPSSSDATRATPSAASSPASSIMASSGTTAVASTSPVSVDREYASSALAAKDAGFGAGSSGASQSHCYPATGKGLVAGNDMTSCIYYPKNADPVSMFFVAFSDAQAGRAQMGELCKEARDMKETAFHAIWNPRRGWGLAVDEAGVTDKSLLEGAEPGEVAYSCPM